MLRMFQTFLMQIVIGENIDDDGDLIEIQVR